MKKLISITLLVLATTIILTACGGSGMTTTPQQSPDVTPDVTPDPGTSTTPPPITDPLPPDGVSSVKVLYNRIDWRENMDRTVIIRSVEELLEFSESLEIIRLNGRDEGLIERITGVKYDDAFFEDHFLVMVTVSETSGSNRHEVTSVKINNGMLDIEIERQIPDVGTADMAGWLITIELSNDYSISGEVNMTFIGVPISS